MLPRMGDLSAKTDLCADGTFDGAYPSPSRTLERRGQDRLMSDHDRPHREIREADIRFNRRERTIARLLWVLLAIAGFGLGLLTYLLAV